MTRDSCEECAASLSLIPESVGSANAVNTKSLILRENLYSKKVLQKFSTKGLFKECSINQLLLDAVLESPIGTYCSPSPFWHRVAWTPLRESQKELREIKNWYPFKNDIQEWINQSD
jgi:hypothetical protein